MIGQTISHYKILEKIGEGGMGVVYKAQDLKLERPVAIKLLPQHLSKDIDAKKRFVREAKAASALNHSNIGVIHEIDETPDNQTFIVMAHYEGETLRDFISRGQIDIREALDISIQIASGLAKAHEEGIIHRDIKPSNILITQDDQAKIVDFGLAKLAGQSKITQTGKTIGTVAYMSPEQAQGEEIDGRSDVFSLGIILYELLTGKSPFKGDYEPAILYEIVNADPESLVLSRPDLPEGLEQIVYKALAKNVDERYQKADDLLSDLRLVQKSLIKGTTVRGSLIAGVSRRRRFSQPILWTVAAIIIGLVLTIRFLYPPKAVPFSKREWILITDFINLTGDDVFDRSLTTALTISIEQSRYVNVFPRSRVRETLQRMGRASADTLDEVLGSEIAQREGIKALIVPAISKLEDSYTLSTRIADPVTMAAFKTETKTVKGKGQILEALGDLAEEIRKDLGESILSIAGQNVGLPRATTHSLQALKYFVEGDRAWSLRKFDEAFSMFQTAAELDSNFAWAHLNLGMFYYYWNNRPQGDKHFDRVLSQLDRLTERERLWYRSLIESTKGNLEDAISSLKIYLSKYPDASVAWFNLGNAYMKLEQNEEAISAYKKSLDIYPDNANPLINIATCYAKMGRYNESLPYYEKTFKLHPEWMTSGNLNHEYGFVHVQMGELQKAEEIFNKMLPLGDRQKARGYRSLGILYMYQGKYSSAIDYLKEATVRHKVLNQTVSEARDRLYLASAYRAKGNMDSFFEELNLIEQIKENQYLESLYLSLAGKMYVRAGEIGQAERLLEDLLSELNENQRNDVAHFKTLKGEIELAKGNYNEAVNLLEEATMLRQDNFSLESLAYVCFLKGDIEQAIAKYEELISDKGLFGWETQEWWLQSHFQLGKIYEEKGDTAKASEYYQRLLDIWINADEDLPLLIETKARLAKLTEATTDKDP